MTDLSKVRFVKVRRVRDALLLTCEDCKEVIWRATDPYFSLGNVRWMHERGYPDHRLVMWTWEMA